MFTPNDSHTQWMDHLSQTDLSEFASGSLPPERMLACDDHLSTCEACRASLAQSINADGQLGALMEDVADAGATHLTYDETRLIAEGKLAPAGAQRHLVECARCADEVADLREFATATTRLPRSVDGRKAPPAYGAIAAGVLIAAVGVGAWYQQHKPASGVPSSAPQVASVAPALPTEYQALVAQTTATGKLPISDAMAGEQKDEILLGEKVQPPPFRVLSPANVVVLDDRPVFSWQPAPGATGYKVAVYDRQYQKVVESEMVTAATWRPSVALKRDAVYSWSITAVTAHGTVRTPAPPQPEVHFRVMSEAKAQHLQAVSAQFPDQHLLLASLYAKEGDLGMAKCQLDVLEKKDPDSTLIKSLEASLAAKCVTVN